MRAPSSRIMKVALVLAATAFAVLPGGVEFGAPATAASPAAAYPPSSGY